MRILVIGDPHGALDKIKRIPLKGIDVILLTGDVGKADLARARSFEETKRRIQGLPKLEDDIDFTKKSSKEIYDSTIDILEYLSKYAPVYSILGNVWISDTPIKRDEKKFGIRLPHLREYIREMKRVYIVRNRLRKISNLRIGFLEYFTDNCWIEEFKEKDKKEIKKAKKETEKARRILDRFGSGLDILVCHQPPYGILDKVNFPGVPENWKGKHAGSKIILDYIKKYKPRYVFCGHIHEGEGMKKIGKSEVYNLGVAGYKIIELSKFIS